VLAAPDVLVLALLALTLPVAVAVALGQLRPWLVGPAAVVAFALLWRHRLEPVEPSRAALVGGLVALVGALLWAVVQVRLSGENIVVDRDPAVYALTGIWLTDHRSVAVPMTDALRATSGIDTAGTVALGFGRSADPLRPEANHTVPGLVATVGWAGGVRAVLAANVAIASVALLAFYAALRRLVGPAWALLPPATLALSMPMVAVARSTYSEPLALAMACGAVGVLAVALTRDDWAARRSPFVLAGLFAGAVALARVDGGLVLVGAALAVGAAGALRPVPWREGRAALWSLAGTGCALLGLGLLDLALNSGRYLTRSRESVGVVAIVLALVLSVAISAWLLRSSRLPAWVDSHRRQLAVVAGGLTGAAALLLLSRPWWMQARHFAGSSGFEADIERYQAAEGLPADGARSYDELTLTWVSWYLGWPTVLVGLAGVVAMVAVAVRSRRLPLLAVLLPLGVPALVYLVYPNITPDHVWAMRRLLVGAVPLLLAGVTFVLAEAARRSRPLLVLALVAAAVVLVWPTTTFSGLYGVRDRTGQLAEAQAGCATIRDGRVVVAGSRPGFDYVATPRIVCDAQVVQMTQVSQQALARLVAQWGGEPLSLLTFDPASVPWTTPPSDPIHSSAIASWERSLIGPPEQAPVQERRMWAGLVQPDGRVVPIEP
jgi:hypothetical protein